MDASQNRSIRLRPIRLSFKITHENCFSLLLAMIWANNTLLTYFRAILVRIPYISEYRDYFMTYLFMLVLILALPHMIKHIRPGMILAYLLVTAVYLINMLFFPKNQQALDENVVPFLIESLPLIFVGATVDLKKHYRMLYNISFVSVIVRFVHLLLEPNNVVYGDMHSSYLLLPHVCMVMATALSHMSLLNISVSIVGLFSIISFGTRGPILCMLVLVVCYMVLYKKIYKHLWFFILVLVVLFGISFFYEELVQLTLTLIQNMGMSTRVMDMLLSGDIASSSGRDTIQAKLLAAISDNWFGYGIAGDRAIVGTYAHNILIELWVSFGVIVGTAIFAAFTFFVVKLLIQKAIRYKEEDATLIALFASITVKLFLSSSYLSEPLLYLMIGLIAAEHRKHNTGSAEVPAVRYRKWSI